MRKIRRKREKRKRNIVIISVFAFLIIMTGGYAAFNTNISLHAKGNILCKGKSAKEIMEKNLVTDGSGIYKDSYEDGRYVYRGAEVNNYINFNDELWRIIAVEVNGTLKIIRWESIGQMSFDNKGHRTTGYCAYSGTSCNVWAATANMVGSPEVFTGDSASGVVEADSNLNDYLNNTYYYTLSNDAQKLVVNYDYNIGGVSYTNVKSTSYTMSQQLEDEAKYKWNGKVALINLSDFIRSNSNNENYCDRSYGSHENNYVTTGCLNTTWIRSNQSIGWTLTSYSITTHSVWSLENYESGVDGNMTENVFPLVHLTSELKLCGLGTESNPYELS